MEYNDIVTVTVNPTVDLSMEVDELTAEGKNRARMTSVRAGGGGINVARCIARLGGSATTIHTTGRETGRRLDRLLDEEGLRHVGIVISSDTREAFVIADSSSGGSYHVVPPGPRLTAREESRLLTTIRAASANAGFLVLSGSATPELRVDFSAQLTREASSGTRVILDIAGSQLRTALAEHSFLIRLDRREAATLLGHEVKSHADARSANDLLLAGRSCDHAVTTVGSLGAVYSDQRAHYEISAPHLPHPFRSDACLKRQSGRRDHVSPCRRHRAPARMRTRCRRRSRDRAIAGNRRLRWCERGRPRPAGPKPTNRTQSVVRGYASVRSAPHRTPPAAGHEIARRHAATQRCPGRRS